jgi:DNA-binding LytR/AlgR family response regulator
MQKDVEEDLPLRLGNTAYFVPKREVLFFETYDGKVYAHTKTGMLQTDLRLFELEQSLPYYFLRISKSTIVNVRMIASLKRELTGNGSVTFKESDKLAYFSRAYHKILKDKIEEVRFSK